MLQNIRVDIEPRSFVVITGPSGGGKSTLLNIVAGLDPDYEGEVTSVIPIPLSATSFSRRACCPGAPSSRTSRWRYQRAISSSPASSEMLWQVGLEAAASQYPERLSLGMQRRAALARGFITEPDILFRDAGRSSPSTIRRRRALREVLMAPWTRRPTTVLFVTHDRAEAVMLGTRILRLAGSRCDNRRG